MPEVYFGASTSPVSVAGVLTLNCLAGFYFNVALFENITSILFTNLPASPLAITISVRIVQDISPRTVTWPTAFNWAGGTTGAVSVGSGDVDLIIITSFDQGATWLASIGNDFS